MDFLLRSTALVFAMTGCSLDPDRAGDPPGGSYPGGTGTGSGGDRPPPIARGPQTLSDVHVDPTGDQVWIIHSAVADLHATPQVTTAHFGAYVPAQNAFIDVLDTTGTLGKKILFPAKDRVLLVTQRGETEDVFASIDSIAHRPVNQHSYPGDRTNFRLSPTGRAAIADNTDAMLHLVDTDSLVDQALPGTDAVRDAAWSPTTDVLYTIDLEGSSTRLQCFDLRTADLGKPIAAPTLVATVPGAGVSLAVSPDAGFVAVFFRFGAGAGQLAIVDVATGASRILRDDALPVFTGDGRAVVWQANPDRTHDLELVTPATGAATPPVKIDYQLPPSSLALQSSHAIIAQPFPFEDKPAFLFDTIGGARTPLSSPVFPDSLFERPGHAEVWMWEEYDDTLRRVDLTTGTVDDVVRNVDSVDYRAATDDIVIGTFDHSVRLFSMATRTTTASLVLADPNDDPAPYRLTTE